MDSGLIKSTLKYFFDYSRNNTGLKKKTKEKNKKSYLVSLVFKSLFLCLLSIHSNSSRLLPLHFDKKNKPIKLQHKTALMMSTKATQDNFIMVPSRLMNHHQLDSKPSGERKVPVVYYLSRNGQLDHPHFIEVPLSFHNGLYLKGSKNLIFLLCFAYSVFDFIKFRFLFCFLRCDQSIE